MANKIKSFFSRKWIWLLCLLALVAVVLISAWLISRVHLEIHLTGDAVLHAEAGQLYQDPGAQGIYYGVFRQIPVTVNTDGTVDTMVPGEYTITYTCTYDKHQVVLERKVIVADTCPPEIELNYIEGYEPLYGEEYQEEGFRAFDSFDGELTDQVNTRMENGVVYYSVTDAAGNTTEIQRIVRFRDPEAPQLELLGQETVTLEFGEVYTDPGWKATDNVDGEITDKVSVEGVIDSNRAGTYTVTYTAKDEYGNITSATRKVVVKPRTVTNDPEFPSQKVIYLTFDDGPGPYTMQLLDVLDKYDIKVTFFVVKTKFLELLPEITSRGHSIGIHSTTHKFEEIYESDDAFFNDLYTMQEIIREYTGVTTYLTRFPGGTGNTATRKINEGIMTRLSKEVPARGFYYFDWNVDSYDSSAAKTADEVFKKVTKSAGRKNNAIVLQHDLKSYSVEAVERIIQWGLENGYVFKPLTENSPGFRHKPLN